jgi:AraC-like DNA-binding protein
MRDREEHQQQRVDEILSSLREATERRDDASQLYLSECIAWEDAVRRAYEDAIRVNAKELEPTIAEMADALEISEKTFQHVRHRPPGTAAWPRPQTRNPES